MVSTLFGVTHLFSFPVILPTRSRPVLFSHMWLFWREHVTMWRCTTIGAPSTSCLQWITTSTWLTVCLTSKGLWFRPWTWPPYIRLSYIYEIIKSMFSNVKRNYQCLKINCTSILNCSKMIWICFNRWIIRINQLIVYVVHRYPRITFCSFFYVDSFLLLGGGGGRAGWVLRLWRVYFRMFVNAEVNEFISFEVGDQPDDVFLPPKNVPCYYGTDSD